MGAGLRDHRGLPRMSSSPAVTKRASDTTQDGEENVKVVWQSSRQTAYHAMHFVKDTDALIIDLRKNGGGDPQMVQYLTSYLFADNTHLNSFYTRATNEITEFWTMDDVPSFFATTPVFILIGVATFSGAEEFAYNLQARKRAVIVGQPSRGGANPFAYFELEGGFRAGIPVAMAVNPVTHTNWEGVGVAPDITVPEEQALNRARMLALAGLRKNKTGYALEEVQSAISALHTQ